MIPLSFHQPPTLEGKRVLLKPMELEHAGPLFRISHDDIWTYMLNEVKTKQDMEALVANAVELREKGTALPFVVLSKETSEIIGTTRLYGIDPVQRCCELGSTWYARNYQRTFVNSECKFLLLKYCFEELRLIRVQLKTDERNKRSQKAIERLGAVKEGIMRNERILSNGYIRNAVLYSIIDEDWNEIKQRFIEREIGKKPVDNDGSLQME